MNRKRVLVVDDNGFLQTAVRRVLTDAGHVVVTVGSGEEALAKFEDEEFDLLVTDLHMPGMQGDELARRAKAKHPSLPVLLITANPEQHLFPDITCVLAKPFTASELRSMVTAMTT